MGNMLHSGLDGEKEAGNIPVANSKQKEDMEMYGQLPDYGDLLGYDLWAHTELIHAAGGFMPIFASQHGKL